MVKPPWRIFGSSGFCFFLSFTHLIYCKSRFWVKLFVCQLSIGNAQVALVSPLLLKRYFRIDEVAAYFAISARTVYRLLDEGDLQATRIRGCVRVSAEEIRRFEETLKEMLWR
jgi:excisionase family DNA binding protein